MQLYNTLNKKIELLKPLEQSNVSIYTCGPTVYDYPHIGNWFTFIRYDLLVRTLLNSGFNPTWVMNITDVGHLTSDADEGEDKLEKGASREGKSAWEIANFYNDYFINGLNRLNFIKPQYLPRATDHIQQQIELIKVLETKGYTYKINDGLYYDTSKFPKYSDFAGLDLDEQQSGLRININPQKKNKSDFALWKFSPTDKRRDMEWDSPWGLGFPGWHIECSAMCLKYFGPTIDIHCGGIDHVPIHHTNEIAQSEAANGKPLAQIWMHTNHILINDQKISKSLNNSILLEDILEQNFSLEAFRLYVIESHYRSQSKFNWTGLSSAQNRLLRYYNFSSLRHQPHFLGTTNYYPIDISTVMENDLNTPLALKKIEDFINLAETQSISLSSLENATNQIDNFLGLKLSYVPDINQQIKKLIQDREKARKKGDWIAADNIRNQLLSNNIIILDSAQGPIWQYSQLPKN